MNHHPPARPTEPVDLTPARLRKLVLRLAGLPPGAVYQITLIIFDDKSEPLLSVAHQGKLEGYCKVQKTVVD